MAQRVVNIGTSVNKGDGDPLRTAFDKINDNFTELYADLQNANQTVNVKGSLFGDDSTLLVDGVNSTIPAANLSGAMPAIDGSALTGITVASVDFSNVTNLPTTLAGHGITDVLVQFSDLANLPQTLQGYGIIDAVQSGGDFEGNLTGSVFADDSTVLVDGVNGTLNSSALTKPIALADNEKIIFGDDDDLEIFHNASNGNTIIENNTGNLVIKGSNLFLQSASSEYFFRGAANGAVTLYYDNVATFNTSAAGIQIEQGIEEKFDTLTGSTGTVTHDCDNGHIFYHTTPAADWTANFTNLDLTAEYATTLSIVIDQGATAYIPSAVQIGGVAQTLLWQGGSAPSGTADGTDVVAFSILNDGGTYVVMGQLVGFS